MRGRSRNKGPNPLTRSYESNGPDVKIRGTAQHVADKYSQLSRDAQASGDPVAAENYLQHAEHYYRLIAAAQEQYRQQYGGFQRDEDGEDGDDEAGFGGQPGGPGGEDFGDMPAFPQGGGQGGGYEPRQGGNRFERDRHNQNRQRFDRNGYGQNGAEQRFDRQGGGERHDRQNGYDRQDRQGQDRQGQRERFGRDDRPRDDRPRDDRPREDRPREDRGGREGYAPREARPERRPAYGAEPQGGGEEEREAGGNLPAFLTTPVPRQQAISVDEVAESAGLAPPAAPSPDEPEATGIRPRRRRTRKADQAPAEGVDETADGA